MSQFAANQSLLQRESSLNFLEVLGRLTPGFEDLTIWCPRTIKDESAELPTK